jgi:DNA-binding transcriptional MerR regulator
MVRKRKVDQETVTARQLAARAEEPYDTIDHWAGFGLLSYRRRGRNRHFPLRESLDRCRRIRELQDRGHSLTTINGMLNGGS